MIALAGSGVALGTLAAIALGVASSSLVRRRRTVKTTVPERRFNGQGTTAALAREIDSCTEVSTEIVLEDGPVYTRNLRFQAIVALPEGFPAGREVIRVKLSKLAGPACAVPTPTWRQVEGTRGPELVLDGAIEFTDDDPQGRRFGDYELEVEVRAPGRRVDNASRGSARRRFRVGYVETFRRPAHEIFSGSSSWSTTSRGELKGQGPTTSHGTGAIRLLQTFAEHDDLGLRMNLRYELAGDSTSAKDEPATLELQLAEHFTARIRPGHHTPVELCERGEPLACAGDSSPVFFGHGERAGDLRLDFRVRREGNRTRLLLFVDGLLARSAYVPTELPEWPWTMVFACRGLTVFVEDLEAGPLGEAEVDGEGSHSPT